MEDRTHGRLGEILDFAIKTSQEESIVRALASLLKHESLNKKVILTSDFALMSMGFTVYDGDRAILSGGVIYHGSTEQEKVDNFSTTVEPHQGWSIHT